MTDDLIYNKSVLVLHISKNIFKQKYTKYGIQMKLHLKWLVHEIKVLLSNDPNHNQACKKE